MKFSSTHLQREKETKWKSGNHEVNRGKSWKIEVNQGKLRKIKVN